jgi:septal ring factor EnvC (AmiA/AmiB activator)
MQSSHSLERNLNILSQITQNDLSLIKEYSKNRDDLLIKKRHLSERRSRLEKLHATLADEEALIERQQKQKISLLHRLKQTKVDLPARLREEAGADSLFSKKGELSWPVHGKVERSFGPAKEAMITTPSKGLFFAADQLTGVKSIFSGKVRFVGFTPGFGNTMIVDHGDHYYSVYAGIADVKKNIGDSVKNGEFLGTLTSTAFSEKPNLYFEIRHFQSSLNPLAWLKRRPHENF